MRMVLLGFAAWVGAGLLQKHTSFPIREGRQNIPLLICEAIGLVGRVDLGITGDPVRNIVEVGMEQVDIEQKNQHKYHLNISVESNYQIAQNSQKLE